MFSHLVHENGLFHGQSSIFDGFVHGNGLFHGQVRYRGGVVHENGLFHGQQTSVVDEGFGKVQVVEEKWRW